MKSQNYDYFGGLHSHKKVAPLLLIDILYNNNLFVCVSY